jgi:hypothetical protein
MFYPSLAECAITFKGWYGLACDHQVFFSRWVSVNRIAPGNLKESI